MDQAWVRRVADRRLEIGCFSIQALLCAGAECKYSKQFRIEVETDWKC